MRSMFNDWLIAPTIFPGNHLVCLLGESIPLDQDKNMFLTPSQITQLSPFPNATEAQGCRQGLLYSLYGLKLL